MQLKKETVMHRPSTGYALDEARFPAFGGYVGGVYVSMEARTQRVLAIVCA